MKKDVRVYLEDMLESIDKIIEYTSGVTSEQFNRDTQLQDSVFRRLEIIGEAVKNIPQDFREKHQQIPWKKVAGMLDILIHEYSGVRLERVWKVIQEDIHTLKEKLLEITDKLDK